VARAAVKGSGGLSCRLGGDELGALAQDEHGHEFLVATFEDEARRALGEYTARGHKQTYAIRVSQEE
jgi:hypothetical protein